jgi:hypothetical protein
MLYKVLRQIVESFLPNPYYGAIKKCILIRRFAEASYDDRGLSARIREVDRMYKNVVIPNSLDMDTAMRHAFVMDDIFYYQALRKQ